MIQAHDFVWVSLALDRLAEHKIVPDPDPSGDNCSWLATLKKGEKSPYPEN